MTDQLTLRIKNPTPRSGLPWTSDDWETPNGLAKALVSILEAETPDDAPRTVIEMGGGNGQITQFIPPTWDCTAIERNPDRVSTGQTKAPHARWICGDFRDWDSGQKVTAFISNPPFSIAMELILHAAKFLADDGCMVLLLPSAYFQAKGVGRAFIESGLCIARTYPIVGRVAYLKGGVAHNNRQCHDSIFVIRLAEGDCGVRLLEVESWG